MRKTRRQDPRPEWVLIESSLAAYARNPVNRESALFNFEKLVPEDQRSNIDAILASKSLSYREMALIQLAFKLGNPEVDPTRRPEGARGVGGLLGDYLAMHHIKGTADAYQNTGKNDDNLIRGNHRHSDSFLFWAREASPEQVRACFEYISAELAAAAHPVLPMPDLAPIKLTFANVMALFSEMLAERSEGAYQQYMVAALLDVFQEYSRTGFYVETKPLNASDKSSKAAGDVIVAAGQKVQHAYEVTANDWRTKTVGAVQKMREHSLKGVHIIAAVDDYGSMASELADVQGDVSVVDLHGFAATILSMLSKTHRSLVLERLYEYLDGYGQSSDRVNGYVTMLISRGLGVPRQE